MRFSRGELDSVWAGLPAPEAFGLQPSARQLGELSELVDAGGISVRHLRAASPCGISVRLERTFSLEKAPEALEESRAGHVRGKVVLLIEEGPSTLRRGSPEYQHR